MEKTFWPSWSENKIFTILVAVLLIMLIGFVGFGVASKIKAYDYIGVSPETKNTIRVTGEGTVIAVPDVAKVTIGTEATENTVEVAQKEVNEDINALIKSLKSDFDIEKEDIKTVNYNIYPEYDYREGSRVFRGFKVTQSVEVTIRNTEDAGEIIAFAGELGLKNVSGLRFTIDDEEQYKQKARELAIENAKEKAEELAEIAGVKLGRIVTFNESEAGRPDVLYKSYAEDEAVGFGGGVEAPEIEAGSQEIRIVATVEYEIL